MQTVKRSLSDRILNNSGGGSCEIGELEGMIQIAIPCENVTARVVFPTRENGMDVENHHDREFTKNKRTQETE